MISSKRDFLTTYLEKEVVKNWIYERVHVQFSHACRGCLFESSLMSRSLCAWKGGIRKKTPRLTRYKGCVCVIMCIVRRVVSHHQWGYKCYLVVAHWHAGNILDSTHQIIGSSFWGPRQFAPPIYFGGAGSPQCSEGHVHNVRMSQDIMRAMPGRCIGSPQSSGEAGASAPNCTKSLLADEESHFPLLYFGLIDGER